MEREISAGGLSHRFHRARPGLLLIAVRGQVGVAPLDKIAQVQQHLSRTGRFFRVHEDLAQFENAHAEAPSAQLHD